MICTGFPPDYFGCYGAALPGATPSGSGAGFPPDYFGWFGAACPGWTPPSGLIDDGQPLSDALALCWVRDALKDSNLFVSVRLGRFIRPIGSGDFPSAWVYPVGFVESDDVDPIQLTRTLHYAVALAVRPEDPNDETGALLAMDLLSNRVANLLCEDGPEGYLPGLSRIEGGRYDVLTGSLSRPESANGVPTAGNFTAGLTLMGSIAYFVNGRGGRNTDD